MCKHALVTGGAGMIGVAAIRTLLNAGHRVTCYDLTEQLQRRAEELHELQKLGDLRIQSGTIMDKWSLAIACQGVDAVIHLAAMLGVKRTEDNRLLCLDININGTQNVLEAAALNKVDHVVVASSSEVYGEPTENPVTETTELKGKTVYAVTKLACEELARGYHQIKPNFNYTIIRFFNTYGEGQVAQFALSRFVKRVLNGKNPQVFGDGEQTRSFCHVEDAGGGVRKIVENPAARNGVFNIGNSSQVYSMAQAARLVIDTLAPGKGLEVEHVPFEHSDRSEQREIITRYCDTSHAAAKLGYSPAIDLVEGIRRIAASRGIHEDWQSTNAIPDFSPRK